MALLHYVVLEIWLYYITWLGLSSTLIYTYIVTMAMDGRLKASVVIWSVEAHESQQADHIMRRGPNIDISSVSSVCYYTTDCQDCVL